MTKRTLYLLLALVVVSSIALATLQGEDLQGAFNKSLGSTTKSSTAILHVSKNGSGTSSFYWDDSTVYTLGSWKIKVDQDLTVDGLSFYIGPVTGLGVTADNYTNHFFNDCSLSMQKSEGGSVLTMDSLNCNTFENEMVGLTGGKSYIVTLSGTSKSDALTDFLDKSYSGSQMGLVIEGVTKDGTKVMYYDSGFTSLVSQEETGSTVRSSKTVSVGYSYGGYTLNSAVYEKTTDTGISITPGTDLTVDTQQSYSTKSNTTTITPGTSSVQNLLNNIKVSIGNTSAVTKALTIKISAGGTTMEISNGNSTKTCTSSTSGSYSCDIP